MDRSESSARAGPGIVFGEPWSLMYASGLARWSRAPCGWSTSSCQGTPLCYGHCYVHYILSPLCPPFSLSLRGVSHFLRLALSSRLSFPLALVRRCISPSRSFSRLTPLPWCARGDTHARMLSLFLSRVFPRSFSAFLSFGASFSVSFSPFSFSSVFFGPCFPSFLFSLSPVSSVRFSLRKFAHLVTRSNAHSRPW